MSRPFIPDFIKILALFGSAFFVTSLIATGVVILHKPVTVATSAITLTLLAISGCRSFAGIRESFKRLSKDYWLVAVIVVAVQTAGFAYGAAINTMKIVSDRLPSIALRENGKIVSLRRSRKVSDCMVRISISMDQFGDHEICGDHLGLVDVPTGSAVFVVRESILGATIEKIETMESQPSTTKSQVRESN